MQFDYWFPTTIYHTDLNPSKETFDGMIGYVDDFYRKTYPELDTSITGDVNGDYRIYDRPEFQWLNNQVGIHCKKYLEHIGVDTEKVDLYAQKAWPVVCNTGGGSVAPHRHLNSVLSVVYWLQVDDHESGGITFSSSNTFTDMPLSFDNWCPANADETTYSPVTNKLIVFPSNLYHRVEPHFGENLRYSITYDIMVVSKDRTNIEHFITDPTTWKSVTAF
jgi:uncharacterized protein (TIGR02466 family)